MKIMFPEYDLNLEIKENRVNVLVVENSSIMGELVRELYTQWNGEEGRFVLSEDNIILPINKKLNFIIDIFSLNCNDKKIISKLYQEIEELTTENLVQENMEINALILCYLEKMCEQVPYHINYQTQILPSMLLKMVDLKFETQAGTLLESVIEYLGVVNKIFNYAANVFVNLKCFLTTKEIESLYEYAFYSKIPLILIEGAVGERLPSEDVTVIDVDKCTIKI